MSAIQNAIFSKRDDTLRAAITAERDLINTRYARYEDITPLMMAAIAGFRSGVQILVKNGADINAVGPSGFTAVVYAAGHGHPKIVKDLLQHGAAINVPDNFATILMDAVSANDVNVADGILALGVRVPLEDIITPCTLSFLPLVASYMSDEEIVTFLINLIAMHLRRDVFDRIPYDDLSCTETITVDDMFRALPLLRLLRILTYIEQHDNLWPETSALPQFITRFMQQDPALFSMQGMFWAKVEMYIRTMKPLPVDVLPALQYLNKLSETSPDSKVGMFLPKIQEYNTRLDKIVKSMASRQKRFTDDILLKIFEQLPPENIAVVAQTVGLVPKINN
jgi:hypothetical protein